MLKKIIGITILLAVLSCLILILIRIRKPPENDPKPKERILILAPHPDDETIGCAGIIQQALASGAEVKVAYLTNGDHNEFAFIVYKKRILLRSSEFIKMGEVRMAEAKKAMKLLGLGDKDLIFLGYPDFGTFSILRSYWGSRPYKDLLTRISRVPYKSNLSYGAPYTGANILLDLKRVLLEYRPDKIYVSSPVDSNVDHKSLYLYLQVCLADLRNLVRMPKIYPYLIHCAGWPKPRHLHMDLALEPPEKFSDGSIGWIRPTLTVEERKKKHACVLSYRSQTESSAFYLLSFVRKNELFGDYPEASLEKPLSQGPITYSVSGGKLFIKIGKDQDILKHFSALVYIFPYKYNQPFERLPKIMILTKYNRVKVFNGFKKMQLSEASVDVSGGAFVLSVPLSLLEDPDIVFISTKVFGRHSLEYFSGFRKMVIKKEGV